MRSVLVALAAVAVIAAGGAAVASSLRNNDAPAEKPASTPSDKAPTDRSSVGQDMSTVQDVSQAEFDKAVKEIQDEARRSGS